MPALNFSPEFVDAVQSGKKCQTIRRQRKNPIKTGDRLYLYTGQRTKACRKLREVKCSSVTPIRIIQEGCKICLDGTPLDYFEASRLARQDGLDNAVEMCAWFAKRYGPEFDGILIRW